jgi:hypothetical protein
MSVKNQSKYYDTTSGMGLVPVQYMIMLLAKDCGFTVTVSSRKKNVNKYICMSVFSTTAALN